MRLGIESRDTAPSDPQGPEAVLHDVRNLLTTVASLVIRTRESMKSAPEVETAQLFEKLGSAVGETLTIAGSGRMGLDRVAFVPATYVSEHVAALAGLFDRANRFSVTLHPVSSSAKVSIPRIDLLRVLTNLVRNAEQASRPEGKVELVVGVVTLEEATDGYDGRLGAGAYVAFQVLDSGCGFDPETIRPALPAGPGRSGIGLEVTTQLLKEAGGGLRIHRREGGGTMVEALVPACG